MKQFPHKNPPKDLQEFPNTEKVIQNFYITRQFSHQKMHLIHTLFRYLNQELSAMKNLLKLQITMEYAKEIAQEYGQSQNPLHAKFI